MAWLAVNKFSMEDTPIELKERIFDIKPTRTANNLWNVYYRLPGLETIGIGLPDGTIKKLIGSELTWDDEPVKLNNYGLVSSR